MPKLKPFPKRPGAGFEGLRQMPIGVYAKQAEKEYHSLQSLSFSNDRNLIVGPNYFWKHSPINPAWVYDANKTPAQIRGQAYHKRLLEGVAAFEAAFYRDVNPLDYPDAIVTADDLKKLCGQHGLKISGTKGELAARLREQQVEFTLWDDVVRAHAEKHQGKQRLAPDLEAEISFAATICEQHPDLKDIWRQGKPEVAIHYIAHDGTPMRARLDFWRPGFIDQLKTGANQMGDPFEVFAARTIIREFYHVQAVIEREAVMAALEMPDELWHGFTPEEIAAYKAAGPPDWNCIFIGSEAPDICQRILAPEVPMDFIRWDDGRPVDQVPRKPSEVWRSAENILNITRARFGQYWRAYGEKPWFSRAGAIGLTDEAAGVGVWGVSRDGEVAGE